MVARGGVSGVADYALALVASEYFELDYSIAVIFLLGSQGAREPCHVANFICPRPDFETELLRRPYIPIHF